MAAILNFLLILMSDISGDCTIVFPTLKTLVSALESRRYLNYWQSYKHFQFIPFVMAAILNVLLISMSGIRCDCTIVFPTFETIDLAVPISHFLAKL